MIPEVPPPPLVSQGEPQAPPGPEYQASGGRPRQPSPLPRQTRLSASGDDTSSTSSQQSQITVIAAPAAAGGGAPTISPANTVVASEDARKWVRFEDQGGGRSTPEIRAAGAADVAQIDISVQQQQSMMRAATPQASATTPSRPQQPAPPDDAPQRFVNGRQLAAIAPENEHCPWIVPATFNPYKMPKMLISDDLTMPVEDYVMAMQMLTNDYRFRMYTVVYRRLISAWLIFGFVILILLLLLGPRGGLLLFGLILIWMFVVAIGILGCVAVKKMINRGLHHCVRDVNQILMRYNLLVGVEDRGKLSCHKIVILFLYFRISDCLPRIMQLVCQYDQELLARAIRQPATVSSVESAQYSIPQPQPNDAQLIERSKLLILKYSQSYVKASTRGTIKFPTRPSEGVSEFAPTHCTKNYCICQYLQKFHFEQPERPWYERYF